MKVIEFFLQGQARKMQTIKMSEPRRQLCLDHFEQLSKELRERFENLKKAEQVRYSDLDVEEYFEAIQNLGFICHELYLGKDYLRQYVDLCLNESERYQRINLESKPKKLNHGSYANN